MRLRDAILTLDGVSRVDIYPSSSKIVVTFDKSRTSLAMIESRARRLGLEIAENFDHESFRLEGLDCPDCALKIEKAVGKLPGVLWVSVNYAASLLLVEYQRNGAASRDNIIKLVRDLGYEVAESYEKSERISKINRRTVATAVSGVFLVTAFVLKNIFVVDFAADTFYILSAIFGGFYPIRAAFYSLRARSIDTNVLMITAAAGAIAIGELFDAAAVMFLFSLGAALESYTVEKTRESVSRLVELSPNEASVLRNGVEVRVPVADVRVGEVVVVKPGDRIPLDGEVISGSSFVDQSIVTGESVPIEKLPGAEVFAGTINQNGALEVSVKRPIGEDTLSRLSRLVEIAQAQKAPYQQFSEKVGRIYTPLVLLSAVIVFAYALLSGDHSFIRRALVLLVVGCPCALVISTPVALVASLGRAAKSGVLIKGGVYLEGLGRAKVFAFDKTGTLTKGCLEVVDVIAANNSCEDVLRLAAAVEQMSEHPIAAAILRRAEAEKLNVPKPIDFKAMPGLGAKAIVEGTECHVGSKRLVETLGLQLPDSLASALESKVGTVVFVVRDRKVIGAIVLSDVLRDGAREIVSTLHKKHAKELFVLTGDNETIAGFVASEVGVDTDNVYAGLMPEEKVSVVHDLVERFGTVVMVGDGVNDAPALAASTVGVAMGGAGSPVSLETADVVLMSDNLMKLPFAVELGQRTLQIIKQNIAISLSAVFLMFVAAFAGKIGLTTGVIGHEASALIVIANGMRLLRFQPRNR